MQSKLFALIIAASLLFCSTTTFAFYGKTERCPSPAAIRLAGLNYAYKVSNGKWEVGMSYAYFDTQDPWLFFIQDFEANDTDVAFDKAFAALSTLRFNNGPIDLPDGTSRCYYTIHLGVGIAVAINPPIHPQ